VASGGLAVSDKRKQFKTIFDKLKKLLPHLGNENQHEANVAREKIIRLLRSVGLDWNDIAVFLGEQQDPVFDLLGKTAGEARGRDGPVGTPQGFVLPLQGARAFRGY
jgi:hypothetical protein